MSEENFNYTENASQYTKPIKGNLYYVSIIFFAIAIFLSIKNIFLINNGKYISEEYFSITYMIFGIKTIDLLIPLCLAIGGILLAIDTRRKKRKIVKSSDLRKLSTQSFIAYTSIFIGAGLFSVIAVIIFLIFLGIALILSGM